MSKRHAPIAGFGDNGSMKSILFVADPLATFKPYKDSTYAMMREAQTRGHSIWFCHPSQIQWQSGETVIASCLRITLNEIQPKANEPDAIWFEAQETQSLALTTFDAVLMRKDPPFDAEYIYATHLLEQAQREGARVFNDPRALRDHPEKLALMQFPQWAPPTLVTRSAADIRAFHATHQDIILKPLDGMGGAGIFRVGQDGMNLGSIIETLNQGGAQTVMVQRYLPEIKDGDKRVLVIGGKPVPYALARIPQGSEVRGNLAAGGKGVAMPLTQYEQEIAEVIGPTLMARGLLLVGLDVIGGRLTEVNVTSPTCFQEITQQSGVPVAGLFLDALEQAMAIR